MQSLSAKQYTLNKSLNDIYILTNISFLDIENTYIYLFLLIS